MQRKRRHEQQHDRGTISRQRAIFDHKTEIEELEEELKTYRNAADKDVQYHRDCIVDAHDKYVVALHKYLKLCQHSCTDDGNGTTLAVDIEKFADSASKLWVYLSSEYQQDKSIPTWNRFPQLGPTYYPSGLTHYIHIIFFEIFGRSTGTIRFSRNVVYTRNEEIGGAKVGDDNFSAVSNELLDYSHPLCNQLRMYRSGYDQHGPIIDLA